MSGAVVSLKANGFFDCMRRWWNLFEMAQAYARNLTLITVVTVMCQNASGFVFCILFKMVSSTGSQMPTCLE